MTTQTDASTVEDAVLSVILALVRELHGGWAADVHVALSSRLDEDLGFDSLSRTELLLRLEAAFQVRLPATLLAEAETVRDLVAAIEKASPRTSVSVTPRAETRLPDVVSPGDAETLIEALEWHAHRNPDRLQTTIIEDERTILATLTYAQLAEAARKIARGLVARGVLPHDRVALMLPTGTDFFVSFFGVLYAGAVPVPIYPPARLSQIEEHVRRQAGILRNAQARLLVTVPQAARVGVLLRGMVETLQAVESADSLSALDAGQALPPPPAAGDTAFIQYTSGSTGDPKGVVLSHANLLANIRAIGQALNASSADVFVSWLPLYHDLGLIGGWLGCLYFGAAFYVMSPLAFLARPASWLWAVHRYRATISASPNFGFELCASKIDETALTGLDLSSLRVVADGAEPVSVATMRRFIARFERYGFPPGALAPAYGLAENTVALTFPPLGRPPLIDRVDRDALTRFGHAQPAESGGRPPIEIPSCGKPIPDHEVKVIGPDGMTLPDRREGRILFRGPSASSGYLDNEAKTRELFRDGWLDSGDQGYLADGELYVTARVKDIIIRAGHHIYPNEIEEAVSELPQVVRNGVAAFGIVDPGAGTERTIVMVETELQDANARAALSAAASQAAARILGITPEEIVLVEPLTVPKTSSGKIRRSAARDLYLSGMHKAAHKSLRSQIARLSVAAARQRMTSVMRWAAAMAYAGWWWLVIAALAPVAVVGIALLPSFSARWTLLRILARVTLRLTAIPLTVKGLEHLKGAPKILVFNHASYTDPLVLAAILPDSPVFAAKKEFSEQWIAGAFIRRLGALFVERFDVKESLADTEAAATIAREGRTMVFFPEGTFTDQPGLHGFHLGAFKIAAETGMPVLPGSIRGTRRLLRGDSWMPRWSPVAVHFEHPIKMEGRDFATAVKLRNEARRLILAQCGEPDLSTLPKPHRPSADSPVTAAG